MATASTAEAPADGPDGAAGRAAVGADLAVPFEARFAGAFALGPDAPFVLRFELPFDLPFEAASPGRFDAPVAGRFAGAFVAGAFVAGAFVAGAFVATAFVAAVPVAAALGAATFADAFAAREAAARAMLSALEATVVGAGGAAGSVLVRDARAGDSDTAALAGRCCRAAAMDSPGGVFGPHYAAVTFRESCARSNRLSTRAEVGPVYIVAIAWLYVVLMMALTERSVVAGIATFAFYGLAPLALFLWLVGTPQRRRNRRSADEPDE